MATTEAPLDFHLSSPDSVTVPGISGGEPTRSRFLHCGGVCPLFCGTFVVLNVFGEIRYHEIGSSLRGTRSGVPLSARSELWPDPRRYRATGGAGTMLLLSP